ncbi:1,4-dihydroxy-2-naphthoate polyprenyltransferase [Nakamurella sp. PAMC28650]|uniref:1,4-dihydroxy-2-naphthoate polyprenyltransferase n=1 Tax=Nakamurella sp. PAMC28650 TaxID=2762325 RepID=UPI00164E2720|nr:1,4-dihydroxy-2-naphthoate polyprenyltransferase [Nakamurella sp. PAMC28650]QNK82820.1 1,4-dihydroxy-2-naphthoate polyprenyltransferase [Nakamurella sp. PAMC28650]
MATATQWLSASRPRTLPAAIAPVLVGSGAGFAVGHLIWWKALLALVVSLALQVGVNFANDYSDGIRGTDEVRVGPMRLVGSGAAAPGQVKLAAFACFGLAGLAGLALAAVTTWWLLPFGVAAVAAAWFYTGGPKPYGYAGFGEIFVFVFFGLLAVLGTMYVNSGRITATSVAAAIGIGLLACALLMINNLRDVATDTVSGKRTLAVLLGDRLARSVLVLTIAGAYLAVVVIGIRHPWCLLGLLSAPLAVVPIRQVLGGDKGPTLIRALGAIGRLEFVYAVLITIGLALGR